MNLGNYCSVNSVVQVLYATRDLQNLIQQVDDQDYRRPNRVARMLKSLILDLHKDDKSPCDPSLLVDAMASYSGVSFVDQEDSDVVFKCIINALVDGYGAAQKIGELWTIENEDRLRCLNCNTVKSIASKSNATPVSIEENLPDELQEYIQQHLDNTQTTCDYHCKNCDIYSQIEITSNVVKLPTVVCVRINRVINIGSDTANIVKIFKRFAFPETLDMKCVTKESAGTVGTGYELYAVVAHRGTHYCGHYTAYIRKDGTWYLTDDTQVTMCCWEDVKTTYETSSESHNDVAYMLMYQKINASQ